MRHTYRAVYITCDEPGCTIQTGGTCIDHGEKGPAFAHWDSWSIEGKDFCPRHSKADERAEITSECCDGTGYADYAAVPCPNPTCPVPTGDQR